MLFPSRKSPPAWRRTETDARPLEAARDACKVTRVSAHEGRVFSGRVPAGARDSGFAWWRACPGRRGPRWRRAWNGVVETALLLLDSWRLNSCLGTGTQTVLKTPSSTEHTLGSIFWILVKGCRRSERQTALINSLGNFF